MLHRLLIWLLLCIAFTAGVGAADPATRPVSTGQAWPKRQILSGLVQDTSGRRVPGAIVFILDATTGVPYSNVTDHPLTDMKVAGQPPVITHVATGVDGRFNIRGVFPGTYRLVAQSWEGTEALSDPMELKSDTTTLCGVAENIRITADREPVPVALKPVGTATVGVTFPYDDTFVLVSTWPLSGDALLGPLSWQGEFLKNLVAATYMRKQQATMHGLPEGRLYFYAMFNDARTLAIGQTSVLAKSAQMVEAPIPVLSPRNGPMKLPERLVALQEEMKRNRGAVDAAARAALGPDFSEQQILRNWFAMPLDHQITLPNGQTATVRDIATVNAYAQFNRSAKEIADRKDAVRER